MSLKMSSKLRFPMGSAINLGIPAMDEFINLVNRISAPTTRKNNLEVFKKHFCKVSGETYTGSSSTDWAESDLNRIALEASKDAAGFIAGFWEACEELQFHGASVPGESNINAILNTHKIPLRITNGELIETSVSVQPPITRLSDSEIVSRALSDAKTLMHTNPSSAVDRSHTSLHGYLAGLCGKAGITLNAQSTTTQAFKQLRQSHPAFQINGPRQNDIMKVLQSIASTIDALSPIRNKASLAHPNQLLDEPEALAVLNAMYTVFRYI